MAREKGTVLGVAAAWDPYRRRLRFMSRIAACSAFLRLRRRIGAGAGYFTEYSGPKHLMFMMSDFVEVVLVAVLVTTLFFGAWQVPYLMRDGFHFPWGGVIGLPSLLVALLQVTAFTLKLIFFTWLQIVIRWTLPRFRYDQLMRLGWQGLLPLALVNVVVTAAVVLLLEKA